MLATGRTRIGAEWRLRFQVKFFLKSIVAGTIANRVSLKNGNLVVAGNQKIDGTIQDGCQDGPFMLCQIGLVKLSDFDEFELAGSDLSEFSETSQFYRQLVPQHFNPATECAVSWHVLYPSPSCAPRGGLLWDAQLTTISCGGGTISRRI